MADRSGGEEGGDTPGGRGRTAARLRLYRGGAPAPRGAGRGRGALGVYDRLARLERRVDEALLQRGLGHARPRIDAMGAAADQVLAAVAALRRGVLGDTIALVARADWRREGLGRELLEHTLAALYRYWWRVEVAGLERVPARGRCILALNRGGALLPYEALMVRIALGRAASPFVDEWLARLPGIGRALAELGAVSTTAQARRVLERDDALVVFPEGTRAAAKPFRDRYRLRSFGRGGFAALAIATGTPVVPVAVIGAEEVHPVLGRLTLPGRLLGLPALPVTPTFPWLGLAGLVPLPTKWTLLVGDPLDPPARHARAAGRLRDQVRERLQALVLEGLRRRQSIFRG